MNRKINIVSEDGFTTTDFVINTKRELWIHTIKTLAIGVVAGASVVGLVLVNHKIDQDKNNSPKEI